MPLAEPRSVVTGAAGGLGRAFCVEIGRLRGRVLVTDVDEDGAEETAELVRRSGGQARVLGCDVRELAQLEAVAEMATEWFGDVDLLVNNAGVAVGGAVGDVPLADWRWAIDINLWGVIHGCHVFVPRMKRRRRGYIVNVASAAGLVSTPEMAPYNVTKAGVVALSETLYAEVRDLGVRVTVLCPSFFQTNIVDASRGPVPPKSIELARTLMKNASVQAPGVAQAALRSVAAGELYAVPMRDGRAMWRLQRAFPGRVGRVLRAATTDGTLINKLWRRAGV